MERSADWMAQALRDVDHAKSDVASGFHPNAHPSGSPGTAYTRAEAERMVRHAEQVIGFCQGLLATL